MGKIIKIFLPKKKPKKQKKELITRIARQDHFIYLHLPQGAQTEWESHHANISIIRHRFKYGSELVYFSYRIIKKQKKPYDYIMIQDYPLLKKIIPFYKKKIVNSTEEIKELKL